MTRFRTFLPGELLLTAVVALSPRLAAQGTRADYTRAAELPKRWENKVFRDQLTPNWYHDGTRFWYRVRTGPDAHEFVTVVAATGERGAPFDHPRLAAALQAAIGEPVHGSRLPVEELEFPSEPAAVDLRVGGRWWRWTAAAGELRPLPGRSVEASGRDPARVPKASRRTGTETRVHFVNRTEGEVRLFWLDAEGERQGYGRLGPGERRSQHTFAGHVWVVTDAAGKDLLGVEAEEAEITVTIDASNPPPGASEASAEQPPPPGSSPDGCYEAFVREHNLWLRDRASGEEAPLSTDGSREAAYEPLVHWSPDSTRLVAIRAQEGEGRQVHVVESSPKDQVQPKLHRYAYDKPGDRLRLEQPRLFHARERRRIEVASNLFAHPFGLSEFRWALDSSRFTFVYNERGHQVLRVVAVDGATGRAHALVDEQSPTFIDYAHKQFLHVLDASRELIWMSERSGWNHLYLIDGDTGQVKNPITRGSWVVQEVDHIDADRRQVWFRAGGIYPGQDPYHVHYARVNFDGSGLTLLTDGDGTHEVRYSPDRRWVVDRWSRVDLPPVTELRSGEDGVRVCLLERAEVRDLLRAGWRPPERFVAKGRDGTTDIFGIIRRPTTYDPRRKYPVIEEIYAGPQGAHVPKAFHVYAKPQALAELGFIVVQIDGMGTSGRSKAFHDVCWRNLGDAGFPDRIPWIRAAAAKDPAMDLTRVGIYGGSAGGQNAAGALLRHGDFYQVGVADCGCHDNRMDKVWWNELWMGWPVGPHYEASSNVTQAHRLQGKLLLIVGELDHNVDPASTLQVVNALVKADKDFDLLVLPGVGHGAAETPYGTRRRMDYFVRHLLGVEPRSR